MGRLRLEPGLTGRAKFLLYLLAVLADSTLRLRAVFKRSLHPNLFSPHVVFPRSSVCAAALTRYRAGARIGDDADGRHARLREINPRKSGRCAAGAAVQRYGDARGARLHSGSYRCFK